MARVNKSKGISKSFTLASQKALIKYYEVTVKAGSEFDLKDLVEIITEVRSYIDYNWPAKDVTSDIASRNQFKDVVSKAIGQL